MGRKGSGVENRGTSIRVSFVFEGQEVRRRLTSNGKALAPTPANLRYAERLVAEIRDKVRMGTFRLADYFEEDAACNTGPGLSVSAMLDRWFQAQRAAHSTLAGYASAAKFWKIAPVQRDRGTVQFGTVPAESAVLSDINTIIAARPSLSGKTVNNYVSVLREAFQAAVDDKLLADNPAAKVKRAKWQKPKPDPFSLDEARAIIAHVATHWPGHVANYVRFVFFTGLRTSEAVGLRWPSIDWRQKTVLVHEAVVRGMRKDNTKTDRARLVKLNAEALGALTAQKPLTFLADDVVFLDPRSGKGWADERALRRSYWAPTLKKLGIRYRRPYCMRHTYATMLLMSGARPLWVAEQMGHSLDVLLDRYAKWIPSSQDDAEVQRLENFVGGAPARKEGAA